MRFKQTFAMLKAVGPERRATGVVDGLDGVLLAHRGALAGYLDLRSYEKANTSSCSFLE